MVLMPCMRAFASIMVLMPCMRAFGLVPPSLPFRVSHKSFVSQSKFETRIQMISDKRRKELGLGESDDEYDLDQALDANTDVSIRLESDIYSSYLLSFN